MFLSMDSFYNFIKTNPPTIRLQVNDLLLAEYQCPLSETTYDIWSHQNYFIYVISGQKKWYTREQEILVKEGDCLFVKKGAHSVYQYFDSEFCAVVLFIPDGFIRSVLLNNRVPLKNSVERESLYSVKADKYISAYFHSFLTYLSDRAKTNPRLLELKFKELILVAASGNYNEKLSAYFSQLCKTTKPSLPEIMEENFCYPLSLEEFAKISGRSLSSFKRDFKRVFGTSPGKWLKLKRLKHCKYLIENTDKSFSEIAYESGFQNISHFSREFKKYFQLSPTQVREHVNKL